MADSVGPALSKHTIWGFAMQTAYNTPQTSDIRWMPYEGNFSFGEAARNELWDQSDTSDAPHEVIAEGDFAEGDIPMVLKSDSDSLTDLFINWAQTRDSYNQCKWATVYWVETVAGTQRVEAWQDVKLQTLTLRAEGGRPCSCVARAIGRKEYTGHGVSAPDLVALGGFAAPPLWSSASLKVAWNEGAYASDIDFESFELVYNTMLHSAQEGHRIAGSLNPVRLWNTGGHRATLNVSRDMTDLDWYSAYLSHLRDGVDETPYDVGIEFTLSGTATLTVTIPRLGIAQRPRSVDGGTEARRRDTVELLALQSRDGATAPVTFAVS